jgi:streptomycin 6-kinase
MIQALRDRVAERIRAWELTAEGTLETPGSVLVFGTRGHRALVLKVIKRPGDEWRCGEVLDAFDGTGVVRVDDFVDGALLMERLRPGTSLADLAFAGRDEEATQISSRRPRSSSEGSECSRRCSG